MSKTRSLNPLLVILTCAASLWAWMILPEAEQYPIHWNARGEADGFSSKMGVAMVLGIMPFTAITMHWLFAFLLRVETVRKDIKKSGPVYDIVWHGCLWLFLAINVMITATYMGMSKSAAAAVNGEMFLKFMPIATGLFLIVLGNVMGKASQNKYVGVKTPWTLKSRSTWEATHRLSARLWVAGGLAMIVTALLMPSVAGVLVFAALALSIGFVPVVYSYIYYRTAKDKPGPRK